MEALQGFLFVCFSCCSNRALLYILSGCGSRSHRLGDLTGLIQPLSSPEGRSLRPRPPTPPLASPIGVQGTAVSMCSRVQRERAGPCSLFPWDTSPLAGGSVSLRSFPSFPRDPSRNTTTAVLLPRGLLLAGREGGCRHIPDLPTHHRSSSSKYLKRSKHRAMENWEILPNTSVRQ